MLLELIDPESQFIRAVCVSNQSILIAQAHAGEGKVWIQADRLFELANGVGIEEAVGVVHSKLVMTIGFDVGGGGLFDLGRFLGKVGSGQEIAGNVRGEAVDHTEDALNVLALELVGEKNLAGAC